ncbi:hypothetical protein BC830DRAFT_1149253 [Chytriomyces sp. MP71]|nr:hypothetical protein BC830DRAFT_1149253 [Chytriomyces sp. MP71]
MSANLRKRNAGGKVDVVALESDALAKHLNQEMPDAVIDYIQYFGDISNVFKGRIVGVDSTGIDTLYSLAGDPLRKELRIQFKQSVKTVDEAKALLKDMAREAHKILHYDIDKTYVSPNQKKPKDWKWPTPRNGFLAILLWTTVLLAIHVEDEQIPHSILVDARMRAGGPQVFETALFALLIMHAVETVVAIAMLIYARVPFDAAILWIPTVFVFGIPSLQDCMKVCIRYAMLIDPITFGVPENVLNGHYMKYRRILTDEDLGIAKKKKEEDDEDDEDGKDE